MQPFTVHQGTAVVLRRSDVDTDQILPSKYLKRITRTGYEDALFAAWREDPDFELNRPEYQGASILVVGANFGTGSSREVAVWALQGGGFHVVIAPNFGDIFRNNSGKSGLMLVTLPEEQVTRLWELVEADPQRVIEVDLLNCTVTCEGFRAEFSIDDYLRTRLLEGLDDIAVTVRSIGLIEEHEQRRQHPKPSIQHPVAEVVR